MLIFLWLLDSKSEDSTILKKKQWLFYSTHVIIISKNTWIFTFHFPVQSLLCENFELWCSISWHFLNFVASASLLALRTYMLMSIKAIPTSLLTIHGQTPIQWHFLLTAVCGGLWKVTVSRNTPWQGNSLSRLQWALIEDGAMSGFDCMLHDVDSN